MYNEGNPYLIHLINVINLKRQTKIFVFFLTAKTSCIHIMSHFECMIGR